MTPRTLNLSDHDFTRLLAFRDGLRRFLHWSEEQARAAGLTPAQHQLLLAIRGHGAPPSISEVAEHLLLRHHSAVELVDRAERAGLVHREADGDDQRIVRLHLSPAGEVALATLAAAHLEELSRQRLSFEALGEELPDGRR
jgi:DNA-binding MarR family transcriptional regulator